MADSQETRPEERPEPQPPDGQKPEKTGWIEGFMMQSTGLPDDSKPKPTKEEGGTLWSIAGMGLQFAGTAALFALMGYALDRKFGWAPWGLIGLTTVGFVGGLYLLIKESLKQNQEPPAKGGKSR